MTFSCCLHNHHVKRKKNKLKMSRKILSKIVAVSCISGTSYLLGNYVERERLSQHFNKLSENDPYIFHVIDKVKIVLNDRKRCNALIILLVKATARAKCPWYSISSYSFFTFTHRCTIECGQSITNNEIWIPRNGKHFILFRLCNFV